MTARFQRTTNPMDPKNRAEIQAKEVAASSDQHELGTLSEETIFGWAKNSPKDNDKDGMILNILIFCFFCWPLDVGFDTLKTKFLIF